VPDVHLSSQTPRWRRRDRQRVRRSVTSRPLVFFGGVVVVGGVGGVVGFGGGVGEPQLRCFHLTDQRGVRRVSATLARRAGISASRRSGISRRTGHPPCREETGSSARLSPTGRPGSPLGIDPSPWGQHRPLRGPAASRDRESSEGSATVSRPPAGITRQQRCSHARPGRAAKPRMRQNAVLERGGKRIFRSKPVISDNYCYPTGDRDIPRPVRPCVVGPYPNHVSARPCR